MLHLSLSPCTGYQLELASSSRHWCLHIEQPQAQHLPNSTHYYESTSPPEAPPTSTHYYESTSPPEAPPTSTHYYESTSPPEAPPTSTHYYESTSPPEAPPTSTHYYESTSPPEVWDLLVSDASRSLSQRGSKSLTRTFSFTVPGCWNDLPPPSGALDPCQSSSNNWKLISFNTTWLHHKKNTFPFSVSSSFSLSFSPSLASLYLFEQCLRLGVTSTSSVCLPLQD